jgi:hypothetical protein
MKAASKDYSRLGSNPWRQSSIAVGINYSYRFLKLNYRNVTKYSYSYPQLLPDENAKNFSPGVSGEDDCGARGLKGGTGVLYSKRRVD